jgi:hypothetical protein
VAPEEDAQAQEAQASEARAPQAQVSAFPLPAFVLDSLTIIQAAPQWQDLCGRSVRDRSKRAEIAALRIAVSHSLSHRTRRRVSGESAPISRSFDTHRLDFLAVLP